MKDNKLVILFLILHDTSGSQGGSGKGRGLASQIGFLRQYVRSGRMMSERS